MAPSNGSKQPCRKIMFNSTGLTQIQMQKDLCLVLNRSLVLAKTVKERQRQYYNMHFA